MKIKLKLKNRIKGHDNSPGIIYLFNEDMEYYSDDLEYYDISILGPCNIDGERKYAVQGDRDDLENFAREILGERLVRHNVINRSKFNASKVNDNHNSNDETLKGDDEDAIEDDEELKKVKTVIYDVTNFEDKLYELKDIIILSKKQVDQMFTEYIIIGKDSALDQLYEFVDVGDNEDYDKDEVWSYID